mmetsp:Transcript_48549/g.112515  ORF Transcript_48549/g.112515 Transcript_48549/m.112515 type:complete len:114 (-) Transcript_48549:118-459(-)
MWMHCGSLTATTECQLLALDAKAFQGIAVRFPTRHACKYAIAFVDSLNQIDQASFSDLWRPDYDQLMAQAMPKDANWMRTGSKDTQPSSREQGSGFTFRSLLKVHRGPRRAWN